MDQVSAADQPAETGDAAGPGEVPATPSTPPSAADGASDDWAPPAPPDRAPPPLPPPYPEPSHPGGPQLPHNPPPARVDWPHGPASWPKLDLPSEPVDHSTVASRAATVGALVGAVAAALLLLAASWVADLGDDGPTDQAAESSTTTTTAPLPAGVLDIQAVLEKVQPSVVSIEGRGADDPSLIGGGTGIILEEDGLILTNAHVVEPLGDIRVTLFDGSVLGASIVGSLPDEDIALIRARDASGLVPAEFGSSADTKVGDEVVAIGNALNIGGPPTVTRGIVSATNRIVEGPDFTFTGLIQTDAAINPGNSGGPLVNAVGQVIGVNTVVAAGAENLGFAIAIDRVKPLIDDIKAGAGTISADDAVWGASGTDVASLTAAARENFQVEASVGGFVTDIEEASAAQEAGLRLSDVVLRFGGVDITTWNDIEARLRLHDPGDQVEVEIERFGESMSLTVVLDRRGG